MSFMADWYGLRDGRDDFQIMTYSDSEYFFARTDLETDLRNKLNASFRAARPPRLVLYGDWGVGKTHTMRHIEYEIQRNPQMNGKVVFVELPDVLSKSTFQTAHAALLDALGLDKVRNWIFAYQGKYQNSAKDSIKAFAQSEDVATAFLQTIVHGNNGRISWDWLRGMRVSSAESFAVGLPVQLEQSSQMVAVLRVLGMLCWDIEDRRLVFMLDECTKILEVSNADAMSHWRNAFKILSDTQNKDVGIVISISENDPDNFPDALADQQIRSRFGEANYIRLNRFTTAETSEFVKAVFASFIDDQKRTKIIQKRSAETHESINADTYPFTNEAFEIFIESTEQYDQATPRDVLNRLEEILNRSIDEDRHIVDSELINHILN